MKLISSLFGKYSRNTKDIVKILKNLKRKKRKSRQDLIFEKKYKNHFMNNYNEPSTGLMKRAKTYIEKAITKEFYDQQLSSKEKEAVEVFNLMSDDSTKNEEYFKCRGSSWIIGAIYNKINKTVYLNVVRGQEWYFFDRPIPRTKVLALMYIGGRYMWDYFGKRYSNNPMRWYRVSPMLRNSTQNTHNTKRFKKWARRIY